jgi:hypothetical protein
MYSTFVQSIKIFYKPLYAWKFTRHLSTHAPTHETHTHTHTLKEYFGNTFLFIGGCTFLMTYSVMSDASNFQKDLSNVLLTRCSLSSGWKVPIILDNFYIPPKENWQYCNTECLVIHRHTNTTELFLFGPFPFKSHSRSPRYSDCQNIKNYRSCVRISCLLIEESDLMMSWQWRKKPANLSEYRQLLFWHCAVLISNMCYDFGQPWTLPRLVSANKSRLLLGFPHCYEGKIIRSANLNVFS